MASKHDPLEQAKKPANPRVPFTVAQDVGQEETLNKVEAAPPETPSSMPEEAKEPVMGQAAPHPVTIHSPVLALDPSEMRLHHRDDLLAVRRGLQAALNACDERLSVVAQRELKTKPKFRTKVEKRVSLGGGFTNLASGTVISVEHYGEGMYGALLAQFGPHEREPFWE